MDVNEKVDMHYRIAQFLLERMDTLKGRLSEEMNNATALEQERNDAEVKLDLMRQELGEMGSLRENLLRTELARSEAIRDAQNQKTLLDKARKDLDLMRRERDELKERIGRVSGDREDLGYETLYEHTLKERNELRDALTQTEGERDNTVAQRNQAQARAAGAEERQVRLEAEVEELKATIRERLKDTNKQATERENFRVRAITAEDRQLGLEAEVKDLKETISRLQDRNGEKVKERNAARERVKELEKETRKLNLDLKAKDEQQTTAKGTICDNTQRKQQGN